MQAQGFESHYPMERLSVRGYAEVVRHYREIMSIRRRLVKALLAERPDVYIGVDASEFNLGVERKLKDAGIPAIHYVSPQVWAWRGRRVRRGALGHPDPRHVSVRAPLREDRRAGHYVGHRSPT